MEQTEPMLLDAILDSTKISRVKLLPLWIKIFAWIFLVMSAFTPIILVMGMLGYNAKLALYGLETNEPFSGIGLALVALFLLKGTAAFGLLFRKDWAITVAITDAIVGIAVCGFVMIVHPNGFSGSSFSFQPEIILLIPYMIKLFRIKDRWTKAAS